MSQNVLIADSHAERARRVALACSAYGVETRVVSHGAAALEAALAEKPGAMVAQLELPLIDGVRLAEILQANPRTRGLGVLFVGDAAAARPGARRASVIPGDADPDTVARFIHALLQKRRPEPESRPAEKAPSVEGKLAQIALAELLELFLVNRKSGVIELRRGAGRRAETGRILLREGHVVQARSDSVAGEKALFRLLAWRRGSFAFREEAVAEPAAIERPTRALLRESERQAEEWQRLGPDLPSAHARVALKVARSSLPNVLHPLTQEVLLVLEMSESVQQVLDRSSFPDYQVLRTLQTLARRGLVELRADAARPDAAAGGLFAPALAARLRDWLDQGRPRDAAPVDAKLLLIGASRDARQRLRELVAALPGVECTPGGSEPGVWPTLRVPVDEDVAIEVFEAPAEARFAPIWPLAAHGALAVLFAHAGPLDASIDALRAAVDEIAALPRARAFHVLLGPADAARDVERLCQRLGLFDERSVLALPATPERAPAALRELLVRLLP